MTVDNVSDSDDLAADAGDALDQMNDLLDEGGEVSPKGKADVEDLVGELSKEKDDVDLPDLGEGEGEGEGKGKGKEKEDEEDEDEDEDLLDEDEEAELKAAGEPQLLKDVEKKYPKLFKEFKPLRYAVLRDGAFSQVFSTPREAADSAQLNEDYREFESEILAGNNDKVLKAIKDTNAEGYKRFVSTFLPALQESDQGLYVQITSPVVADVLRKVYETGVARGDKNLVNSSKHIASLIWPTHKGAIPDLSTAPDRKSPELEERERKLAEREAQLVQRDQQAFVGSIKGTSERLLRKRVEKGLDPNAVLSPFLKNSVVEKTMREVQEMLNEDQRFNMVMQRTFDRARRSGFTNEYKTRMVGTFIGRAAQLIGPIRRRLLLAALGKTDKGEGGERPPVRRAVGEGSAAGGRERALKASDIDFESSSDLDILSGKARPIRPKK